MVPALTPFVCTFTHATVLSSMIAIEERQGIRDAPSVWKEWHRNFAFIDVERVFCKSKRVAFDVEALGREPPPSWPAWLKAIMLSMLGIPYGVIALDIVMLFQPMCTALTKAWSKMPHNRV